VESVKLFKSSSVSSLKPLYKLQIGEAGESCALYIAQKLGLPKNMLERAYKEAYGDIPDSNTFNGSVENFKNYNSNKIQKSNKSKIIKNSVFKYNIGDSVIVYPSKEIGIVYKPADDKGIVCVQVKGQKKMINHKRLKIKNKAEELYPEDYDFSIIFDSKNNRKARHQMSKHHIEGLVIKDADE
jgi:dsDNA-specific endonuclease/ATPase MutS2